MHRIHASPRAELGEDVGNVIPHAGKRETQRGRDFLVPLVLQANQHLRLASGQLRGPIRPRAGPLQDGQQRFGQGPRFAIPLPVKVAREDRHAGRTFANQGP